MRVRRISRRAAFGAAGVVILLASAPVPVRAETVVSYTYDANGNITGAVVTFEPDTTPPSTPTGLTASAPTSTTVNLNWTASTDNVGVSGYKIFRNSGQIGTSTTTSYADTTVSGTTTYSYTVSAYDAAGNNSAQSSAVGVTTPDTIAPTAPTGLAASAPAYNQVNLSWNASSDSGGSGLAGYKIYRNGAYLTSVTGTSHSDTTVAASTSYSYVVYAYDGANNTSGASNTAPVTTPAAVPSTPAQIWTSPAGVSYGGNFTVLWSASTGPVSYYRLEEDLDGNGSVELTYTINAPSTSKSLSKGGAYKELYYRVQACSASNQCSGLSLQTQITTCPTAGCP